MRSEPTLVFHLSYKDQKEAIKSIVLENASQNLLSRSELVLLRKLLFLQKNLYHQNTLKIQISKHIEAIQFLYMLLLNKSWFLDIFFLPFRYISIHIIILSFQYFTPIYRISKDSSPRFITAGFIKPISLLAQRESTQFYSFFLFSSSFACRESNYDIKLFK